MSNEQQQPSNATPLKTAVVSVRVEYGETANLGNYNNVRPSVTLTASVAPDDDHSAVAKRLLDEARSFVHAAVDDALEAEGQSPRYYDGRLYQAVISRKREAVIVLPVGFKVNDLPGIDTYYGGAGNDGRLESVIKRAEAEGKRRNFAVFVCADGDVSGLPALPTSEPAIERPQQLVEFETSAGDTEDDVDDEDMDDEDG